MLMDGFVSHHHVKRAVSIAFNYEECSSDCVFFLLVMTSQSAYLFLKWNVVEWVNFTLFRFVLLSNRFTRFPKLYKHYHSCPIPLALLGDLVRMCSFPKPRLYPVHLQDLSQFVVLQVNYLHDY